MFIHIAGSESQQFCLSISEIFITSIVKLKDQTATAGTVHGVLTIDVERL